MHLFLYPGSFSHSLAHSVSLISCLVCGCIRNGSSSTAAERTMSISLPLPLFLSPFISHPENTHTRTHYRSHQLSFFPTHFKHTCSQVCTHTNTPIHKHNKNTMPPQYNVSFLPVLNERLKNYVTPYTYTEVCNLSHPSTHPPAILWTSHYSNETLTKCRYKRPWALAGCIFGKWRGRRDKM